MDKTIANYVQKIVKHASVIQNVSLVKNQISKDKVTFVTVLMEHSLTKVTNVNLVIQIVKHVLLLKNVLIVELDIEQTAKVNVLVVGPTVPHVAIIIAFNVISDMKLQIIRDNVNLNVLIIVILVLMEYVVIVVTDIN